jgi:hypothetical protein
MDFSLDKHWLLASLGGLLLLWGVSLAAVRHWTRRRLLKALEGQEAPGEEFSLPFADHRPQDLAAQEVIRAFRRRYLLKLWPDTGLSFTVINDMSLELMKEIARVYYPEEDRPELKASLADLVALHNRVGSRLASWLETLPIRAFKDVDVGTVLRYHELYRDLKDHPGYRFVKRHHLDQVVRWGWSLLNWSNPWHWGRRAALEGGRELVARLTLARIAELVGEEAARVYGRRPAVSPPLTRYLAATQEMINLALENGGLPPGAADYVLRFILRARGLEDREKLGLLRRLAAGRRHEPTGLESLEAGDRKRVHQWLQQMVAAAEDGEARQRYEARLQARWRRLGGGGEA